MQENNLACGAVLVRKLSMGQPFFLAMRRSIPPGQPLRIVRRVPLFYRSHEGCSGLKEASSQTTFMAGGPHAETRTSHSRASNSTGAPPQARAAPRTHKQFQSYRHRATQAAFACFTHSPRGTGFRLRTAGPVEKPEREPRGLPGRYKHDAPPPPIPQSHPRVANHPASPTPPQSLRAARSSLLRALPAYMMVRLWQSTRAPKAGAARRMRQARTSRLPTENIYPSQQRPPAAALTEVKWQLLSRLPKLRALP